MQKGKWNLYILNTARFVYYLVSISDANEGKWLKIWCEFEIYFTEMKEQFYMSLLENFNSTNVGEGKSDLILQYLII